jgi:hypothetical protein
MDPALSDEHRRFTAEDPEVLTAGYASRGPHPHWVCEPCMADFCEEFGWQIED